MNKYLITFLSVVAVAFHATADLPYIYASVYSANSWKEHQLEEIGMYRFGTDSYSRELVMQDPYLDASGGGAMTDDFYFCTAELNYGSFTEITHYMFDPDTWTESLRITDGRSSAVATDMAYDQITAKIYGCFNADSGDGHVFGTLNIATGERFAIAALDLPWVACSFDRTGRLFALDVEGNLMAVDKTDGTAVTIGNTGLVATNRSTGAIDPASGIFYVAMTDTKPNPDPDAGYNLNVSRLYAVDLTTAAATMLYEFADGEALGGMFIPGPAALEGAPDSVTDVVITMPQFELAGTVSFRMPVNTFGGSQLEATELAYTVRTSSQLLAEGTALSGSVVDVPVAFRESGFQKVEITTRNAAGRSPKYKQTVWVGHERPKPVVDVTLTYDNGRFLLQWTQPDEGISGGSYDPARLTYTVTRYPDGAVVASSLTATEFSEPVAVPDSLMTYYYAVESVYDSVASVGVESNRWRLGHVPLPYSQTFEAEDALRDFTVIDVNGDRAEWYREYDWWIDELELVVPVASYPYSSANDADDWLIAPPFRFEAGKTHRLTFEVVTMGYDERLAVAVADRPQPEAMTAVLHDSVYNNQSPTEVVVNIPADAADRVCYVGFHALSKANAGGLGLKSISLNEVSGSDGIVVPGVIDREVPFVTGRTLTASAVGIDVYTTSGVRVAALAPHASISLSPGIYLCQFGGKTVKIAIK